MKRNEEMSRIGIYAIVNTVTGKTYIGMARTSFGVRWSTHRSTLNRQCHENRYLQEDWLKYGADAFEFRILEVFSGDASRGYGRNRERAHKKQINAPLYNIRDW